VIRGILPIPLYVGLGTFSSNRWLELELDRILIPELARPEIYSGPHLEWYDAAEGLL